MGRFSPSPHGRIKDLPDYSYDDVDYDTMLDLAKGRRFQGARSISVQRGMVLFSEHDSFSVKGINNRRFMYNSKTSEILFGGNSPDRSSHAQEWYDTGAKGNFDDCVRGWIGWGGSYRNGVIHFAPPIMGADVNTGFDALLMFKRHGASDKTVVRNFGRMGEQTIEEIINPSQKVAAKYFPMEMIRPWIDSDGNPVNPRTIKLPQLRQVEYDTPVASEQTQEPLRHRPDYGEIEMEIEKRLGRISSIIASALITARSTLKRQYLGIVDLSGDVHTVKVSDVTKEVHRDHFGFMNGDRFRYDDGYMEWTEEPGEDSMFAAQEWFVNRGLPYHENVKYRKIASVGQEGTMPKSLGDINRALKKHGIRLIHGHGYYYPISDERDSDKTWTGDGIYVFDCRNMSIEWWVNEVLEQKEKYMRIGAEKEGKAKVFLPPKKVSNPDNLVSVFLAGSIDMGEAEDWQTEISKALKDTLCVVMNPRREDWDSSWKQDIKNDKFRQQVEWELEGMEKSTLIAMCLTKDSKAPISLLELGLHASEGKMIVCCPKGFWRKGNVDIVCKRYEVPVFEDFDEFKAEVVKRMEKPNVIKKGARGWVMASDRLGRSMVAREFVSGMLRLNTNKERLL